MFAAIAATVDPNALTGYQGEFLDHGGGDCLLPLAFRHRLGAIRVGLGLITDGFQAGNALLQGRVIQIGGALGEDRSWADDRPRECGGRCPVRCTRAAF